MKTQLLAKHQITREDGTACVLSYYLLIEELLDEAGVPVCELYGAKIVREHTDQVVAHSIPRITTLGSEILRIVESLSRGTVVPECMEECVMELLA